MSELKVYHDPKKGPCWREFYEKSEVDKVIAELKQKINEAQTELELWRDGSIISEAHQKEIDEKRHSDYKRCLSMAMWCDDAARLATWDTDYHRCGWYNKSMQRSLKIAEQFKEVK